MSVVFADAVAHILPEIRRGYGTMMNKCLRWLASVLAIAFQAVPSGAGTARAEEGDSPAISGPAVQGAVTPKTSRQGAGELSPAERYEPGGQVRVVPDLRLSDLPRVSPPVSPGVQDRDLREEPRLSPPAQGQQPRVVPDLRESPPNQPSEPGGNPPPRR